MRDVLARGVFMKYPSGRIQPRRQIPRDVFRIVVSETPNSHCSRCKMMLRIKLLEVETLTFLTGWRDDLRAKTPIFNMTSAYECKWIYCVSSVIIVSRMYFHHPKRTLPFRAEIMPPKASQNTNAAFHALPPKLFATTWWTL